MSIRRKAAATLIAFTVAAGAAPAASAAVPALPAPNVNDPSQQLPDGGRKTSDWWMDVPQNSVQLVSPYHNNTPLRCHEVYRTSTNCWQQRPDGQWQPLANYFGTWVYPVWEDPASILGNVPQFGREAIRNATPEPIRSAIPNQVWDLLPR